MTVVIIGAGQAGARAAQQLRASGYRGRVMLIGEEPHLPYERPPLSKAVLQGSDSEASVTLQPASFYEAQAIELRLGVRAIRIRREQRQVDLADGSTLDYERLILATGLRSRQLLGFELGDRMRALRSLDDAAQLRSCLLPGARLLVIGGGFLGLEVAATARRLGCEVTLVERNVSLLYKAVAPLVGDHIVALHRRHGVRIIVGATPRRMSLSADGQRAMVELSNGEELMADTVVNATGSIPNTELAETAGIEVKDGIIADQFGRTSDPHIYAIGDVSRHFNPVIGRTVRVESWQNAENQSAAVARIVCGSTQPYGEVPWFWTDQYDMNLQIVGYPHAWDEVVQRGGGSPERFSVLYLEEGHVVGANLINNGRDTRLMSQWVAQRVRVDAAMAAREDVPLKAAALDAA
ncbi:MAG: NAD(P)/FAD-dependent oxidoreductase [Burkholderiaceae bacterium]